MRQERTPLSTTDHHRVAQQPRGVGTRDCTADASLKLKEHAKACTIRILGHRHRLAVGDRVSLLPITEGHPPPRPGTGPHRQKFQYPPACATILQEFPEKVL